jgi:hypothetical protein
LANGGKIVVINNNNTNINIHPQSGYTNDVVSYPAANSGQMASLNKSPHTNHQKSQSAFNINTISNLRGSNTEARYRATAVRYNQQPKPYQGHTKTKSYIHQNQSIRSSVNNSLNSGLGMTNNAS